MRKYELLVLFRPDPSEEEIDEVVERLKNLIGENGGELVKLDKWGKRRLAYEVNHYREGVYVLLNFNGEPALAHEIDRVLKISDRVLRHMLVREED